MFYKSILTTCLILLCLCIQSVQAQKALPYFNNFEKATDTLDWKHYAISGTDDWQWGIPSQNYLKTAYSSPNAWMTNLTSSFAPNSNRALETPYFNLKDTSKKYAFSFMHKIMSNNSGVGYIEYSINKGSTWNLLVDNTSKSKNWHDNNGFTANNAGNFKNSTHSLRFIQGNDNVKFRFRYETKSKQHEGWLIDNFSIHEEYINLQLTTLETINRPQNCTVIPLEFPVNFYNTYEERLTCKANVYFSKDSIISQDDSIIFTTNPLYTSSKTINYNYNSTIKIPDSLITGEYYIIQFWDVNNEITESNELDNIKISKFIIDSTYSVPYKEDFDGKNMHWKTYSESSVDTVLWELGQGYSHHLEYTHSGKNAWHTSASKNSYVSDCNYDCKPQYLDLVNLNTFDTSKLYLNFWFKNIIAGNKASIEYNVNCVENWRELAIIPDNRNDNWDYLNIPLYLSSNQSSVKYRIRYSRSYLKPEGISIDDIYFGKALPDLTIEHKSIQYFTPTNIKKDTLKYYLCNSGLKKAIASKSTFYYSLDSVLDVSDLFLGSKMENIVGDTSGNWETYVFTKPSTSIDKFWIICLLDSSQKVEEMRENNNFYSFKFSQDAIFNTPYSNNFETNTTGWYHRSSLGNDNWKWDSIKGPILDSAFSNKKGWLFQDTSFLAPMNRMHLYSPAFDISNLTNPVLQFDMNLDDAGKKSISEANINMSYSIDGGVTWIILDTMDQSYNKWYYPMEFNYHNGDRVDIVPSYTLLMMKKDEPAFANKHHYNGRSVTRNTRYNVHLKHLKGVTKIQFRYNLASSKQVIKSIGSDGNYEGVFIDNFSITDGKPDLLVNYKKNLMLSSISPKIKFYMDFKNQGDLKSSSTDVKFYLSKDSVLSIGDYFLGKDSLPEIRPDMFYQLNTRHTAPSNLKDYTYLIYEIDPTDINSENNKVNNIGYWELSLDSIKRYPYSNNFNKSVINGWHSYSHYNNYDSTLGEYRIRNKIAPAEYLYQTKIKSGEFFTEVVPYGLWNEPPTYYLESPAFCFTDIDTVIITFDLMCTGSYTQSRKDGGNLEYSINGGSTWQVLTTKAGEGYNWYNNDKLNDLNNEPGWSGNNGLAKLDSTRFATTIFNNQKNVVFRFKNETNYSPYGDGYAYGLRLDNFRIEALMVDYAVQDSIQLITKNNKINPVKIDLNIINKGQTNGIPTTINYYVSLDSILDINDTLIHQLQLSPISQGDTIGKTAQLAIPFVSLLDSIYCFAHVDGKHSMKESIETNNFKRYLIKFRSNTNYQVISKEDTIKITSISNPSINLNYSIKNNGLYNGKKTVTSFYWSKDSILDSSDSLLKHINESTILSMDTLTKNINLTYPLPINQKTYYLLYKADAFDSLQESNELDNYGLLVLEFNLGISINEINLDDLQIYTQDKNITVKSNLSNNMPVSITIYANDGKLVHLIDDNISTGLNRFSLPENISTGIYFIHIQSAKQSWSNKLFLERK